VDVPSERSYLLTRLKDNEQYIVQVKMVRSLECAPATKRRLAREKSFMPRGAKVR